MKFEIYRGNAEAKILKEWSFPGGELGVKLDVPFHYKNGIAPTQRIVARLSSAADIIELALVKDALTRLCPIPVDLVLPYVPYARQDRVCDTGESFSILVFADMIRAMNFNDIAIMDPHSAVTEAALRPDRVITPFELVAANKDFATRVHESNSVLLAPDASAGKRLKDIASYLGKEIHVAEKVREMSTGKILKTEVPCKDFGGRDVVMIDDICDGGRTFIEIAEAIKGSNPGKIVLYVTHGIFSKGLGPIFSSGIGEIWTTNSIDQSKGYAEMKAFNFGDNVIFHVFDAVNYFTAK